MKHFRNCIAIKGAPYFFPHTLLTEEGHRIHIEHENKLNRGHIKSYYIDKKHFQILAIATDKQCHKFYIYGIPGEPEKGTIAVTSESNFSHYD